MNIGDKIPEILGVDQNGHQIMASGFVGRKIILYSYPKANTSGCTAEACSLQTLGCWGEKVACGHRTIGTVRMTYLVDEEGVIYKNFQPKEIKTKIHAEQILAQL